MKLKIFLGAGCGCFFLFSCLAEMPLLPQVQSSEAQLLKDYCLQQYGQYAETKTADSLWNAAEVNFKKGAKEQGYLNRETAILLCRIAILKNGLGENQKEIETLSAAVAKDNEELQKYLSIMQKLSEIRK